jgi:drug/metabolite transporter (DMT)-like permease
MTSTRLARTSHGTNREAFSPSDWARFVSLSLIWGSSFLFMAIGLDSFHPGLVTLLRVGFGAAVLALIPRARRIRVDAQDWPRIALLGLIWVAIPFTLFPIAQQWIDSAVAGMLNGATPIFTALVATAFLRTLPGRSQMIGLAVGFGGIVAIAAPSAGAGTTQAIGVVMVVAATVCYALSLNLVIPLQQRYGSAAVMARVLWVAAIAVTPFGLLGLRGSEFAWPSLIAVAAVGILGTGLAFILMGALIGRVGATRSAFITYVMPVVALILGVAFRGEVISPIAIAGVALVIAGALLASRRELA